MGALGFAFRSGGVVGPSHLGGVGELGVHGLGSAVHKGISLAGESLGSFEAGLGAVETTGGSLNLGVAQETSLRISCCNSFGERGFHWLGEVKTSNQRVDQ